MKKLMLLSLLLTFSASAFAATHHHHPKHPKHPHHHHQKTRNGTPHHPA